MIEVKVLGKVIGQADGWDESDRPGSVMFHGFISSTPKLFSGDIEIDFSEGTIIRFGEDGEIIGTVQLLELLK